MKKPELILSIAHNIFLTEKERYRLVSREPVSTIGVSIPVWFYKGSTSEPAIEVFCRYTLTNDASAEFIGATKEGYHMNLPQIPKDYQPPKRPTDDEWRQMSFPEQEQWYMNHEVPLSAKNLRNRGDGGAAYLRFQEKVQIKKNNRPVVVAHYIEIKTIDELIESLIM